MRKDDFVRIRHMLDEAREVQQFASGRKREDLKTDRMLILALVKGIEIIGEAAVKITQETKDRYPEIPWASIVGMRNRLVHAYFDKIMTEFGILSRKRGNGARPLLSPPLDACADLLWFPTGGGKTEAGKWGQTSFIPPFLPPHAHGKKKPRAGSKETHEGRG